MTPEEKEDLSEKIVALCHAAGSIGYPETRLLRSLENATYLKRGTPENAELLDRELKYLRGKNWIEEVEKDLRPDARRWTSTSAGDEFLMRRGLL